jgi:LacI family transcriptional regulator
MSVTIKDIAKLANVSHTTVSRALNNSPLIKEKTKKKILDIANQLNYIPDYHAKNLVMQKSHTIGNRNITKLSR